MKTFFALLTVLVSSSAHAASYSCYFKDLVSSKGSYLGGIPLYGDRVDMKVSSLVEQYKIEGEINAIVAWDHLSANISILVSDDRGPIATLKSSGDSSSSLDIFSSGKIVARLYCDRN